VAVVVEECRGGDESGPLVAIDERVVSCDAVSIGGREVKRVGSAIRGQMSRTGERRLQESGVADAGRAAVLGKPTT
jgi:hypothetical protein